MPLPDDLIETKTAARLLKVHVSAIYRWIASGKLPSWRVGGRHKLSRRDVEAFPQRSGPEEPAKNEGQKPRVPTHAEAVAQLRRAKYLD
jgi:excisionase family DNA binding protein